MKKLLLLLLLPTLLFSNDWGKTGHRIVGEIAERQLTQEVKEMVYDILDGESLSSVSTWPDEMRSNPDFKSYDKWHYVNLPLDKEYPEIGHDGDNIVRIIERATAILKSPTADKEMKKFYLKYLVHLVGDLHQPLHVGNGTDRGGNDVRVQWFGDGSNLHRVWDSEMIDSRQHDGRELADFSDDQLTEELIEEWQSTNWLDWAYESQALLPQVYDFEGDRMGYEYMFHNFETVELRILQAGVRLAGLINEIYAE